MNVLGTLMSRGVMHVKETNCRIRNKIRLKGIGFLDSFVDTLLSTTPHHLLMLRNVHFMEALPLCHWSSQLFGLCASLSTDALVQLLNQPVTPALSVKLCARILGNECNTLKCVGQIAKTVFKRCHTLRKFFFLNSSVHLFGFFLFPLHWPLFPSVEILR